MKFGGSSLAGGTALLRVAEIVQQRLVKQPVLVLSAMGKTTNQLLASAQQALETGEVDISSIRASHENVLNEFNVAVPTGVLDLLEDLRRLISGVALLREISPRTRDLIVSFGERLSVRVFAAFFNEYFLPKHGEAGQATKLAKPLDSWEIGMMTTSGGGSANSAYSQAEILQSSYDALASSLEPLKTDYGYIPVVTGYIAKDKHGIITTLGRDGSDLTATVIGAAVMAAEVQIWKDVSGIQTTDPRNVPSARPVHVLTYEEAAELSTFGAKVVHPAAVMPAWISKVPMSILNSTAPEEPGTRIVSELGEKDLRDGRVAALSSKRDITMIVIRSTRMLGQHGFLACVFNVFNKFHASVDVIATSEVSISLTLDQGFKSIDIAGLQSDLQEVATVEVKEAMAMLTLITARQDSTSVLRESFQVFEQLGVRVEMVSHGASNVNITFVIRDSTLSLCSQKLHEAFFEK